MLKYEIGDNSGALKDINQAISLQPDDAESYVIRSNIRENAGDLEGAKQDLDKAHELEK
jgi:Flp pilus assembly protein TadD